MSKHAISVLIIDENRIRCAVIEAGLREAGYANVHSIEQIDGVAQHIQRLKPDVIVIDIENPNRDMLEGLFALTKSLKRPIAMFVDHSDDKTIERAIDAGVSAYVVDGLRKERVKPILEMAIVRFRAYSRMEGELANARLALEGRIVIDQAKAVLMKSKNITEDEAYQLLRRSAMNQNRKIADIAQSLMTAFSLLGS
jgi:response regulator NasT